MGSRAGWCVKDKKGRSPLIRQQWIGSIKENISKMWDTLGGNPGDGGQAIRKDLGWDRGFSALVVSVYNPPFDSIHLDTHCDISDNGLIEVDITDWQDWKIYHYVVGWRDGDDGKEGKKTLIAQRNKDGFKWLVTPTKRAKLGEGLE